MTRSLNQTTMTIFQVVKDLRKQVEKLQEENLNLQFQISSLAQLRPTSGDNLECQTMQTKVASTFDLPRPELVSYRYLCHNYIV